MINPVLIEITRGGRVESTHRGVVAIADIKGELQFALGDVDAPTYPRSALKMVQTLPLVESGAADAFDLGDAEIALACASHSGEPMHTGRVAAWLERIGCSVADLACGPHPSFAEAVNHATIARDEKPTPLFNNCSGKHTGFLTVCRHWGVPIRGYELRSHPLQIAIAKALGELAEIDGEIHCGVDGCLAPAFMLPTRKFAHVLAKFADPSREPEPRRSAMRRIVAAMIAHPDLVAGTGRADTILMRASDKRAAIKFGAEAFFAAILPQAGLGIAIKIDDGTSRAADTAIATVLDKLGVLTLGTAAQEILRAPILNTRAGIVGERQAAPALADAQIRALGAEPQQVIPGQVESGDRRY